MMARFYGWTDNLMMSMLAEDFQDYWLAIPIVEAQESLIEIRNQSFTWLETKDRKQLHRDLNKKAQSIISNSNEPQLNTEEAAKQIAQAMMNGR